MASPVEARNRFGQPSKWRCPGAAPPEPVHVSAESRWCRWCQKRFAKESVFIAHLTGKKHIKALEKGGQVAEAAAIKQKLAIQKMTNQSKDALDKAKQEKAKAEGEGDPDEKKRKHAAEDEQAGSKVSKTANGDDKVDLTDKAAMQLQMARASGHAKKMVNVAVNAEWWKGTVHSTKAEEPDYSALGNGIEVTSTNRSTQKETITEGPGSGPGDWKCPGNYAKQKECGAWNYRNAEKCRVCGSFKRLHK